MFKSKVSVNDKLQDEIKTIIGESAKIDGNFISDSNTKICGNIDGDIEVNGKLIVGEKAKIKANIKAEMVEVNGFVEGNISSDTDVIINESGNVVGDITLGGNLVILPGAVFIGASKMQEKEIDDLNSADGTSDDDIDLDLD